MDELGIYDVKPGRPFYICLKVLVVVGYLPIQNEKKTHFIVRMLLSQLFYFILYMMVFVHVLISIKNHTGMDLTRDITITALLGSSAVSTFLFIIFHQKFLQLCSDLANFDEFGEPEGFKRIFEIINRGNIVLNIYCTIEVIVFTITSLVNTANCERYNEQHGIKDVCKYIMPYWAPVENITLPFTYFMIFAQFVAALTIHFSTVSFIFWIVNAVTLIVIHIDILKQSFRSILEESEPMERKRKLKSWINYHNHILRMAERLGKLTKIIVGHHGFCLSLCWALAGNAFLHEKSSRMAYVFIAVTILVLGVVHHGQILIDVTLSINEEVYSSKWYESDVQMMKNILLILMRSQKPVALKLIPTGSIGYPLFLMVMRSTYSYLTVFARNR